MEAKCLRDLYSRQQHNKATTTSKFKAANLQIPMTEIVPILIPLHQKLATNYLHAGSDLQRDLTGPQHMPKNNPTGSQSESGLWSLGLAQGVGSHWQPTELNKYHCGRSGWSGMGPQHLGPKESFGGSGSGRQTVSMQEQCGRKQEWQAVGKAGLGA